MRLRRLRGALVAMAAVVATGSAGLLGAVPARATMPGPVGRIAFFDYMTGQIYAVNPAGTGLAQLTHTNADHAAIHPMWTPDGTHILYVKIIAGTSDDHARIWIANPDGSDPHQLASDTPGYRDYTPAPTPDGRHIVFSRCKPNGGVCAIWIMRSDGTQKRPLTPYHEGQNEAVDFTPSVSPNGRWVAFSRFGYLGDSVRVWLVRSDGTGAHPLTSPRVTGCGPDWAPDGRSITFIGRCDRAVWNRLMSITPDGEHLTRLTFDSFPNSAFAASHAPSGPRIAFADDRRYDDYCCVDLFTMRADGSDQRFVDTGGINGIVNISWGSAPLSGAVTLSGAMRLSVKGRASAAVKAWCSSRPPFMRIGTCPAGADSSSTAKFKR